MLSKKSVLEEHEYHYPNKAYDFWCVAHGPDYQPKYLKELGTDCHGYLSDGYCSDDCRICPARCPIKPCPLPEEY